MNTEIVIKRLDVPSGKRVLVTSDIHGHMSYLKRILEKASFSGNDLLVVIGDMIEKGPESLKTLRYIMALYESGNVVVLSGNVDMWRVQMLENINERNAKDFYEYLLYMRKWYGTSLFDEMMSELGRTAAKPEDLIDIRNLILTCFNKELDFIRNLPTVLDTQNYTFVHGGLPENFYNSIKSFNIYSLLKYNNFMSENLHFDKYIVVGHWPVTLYNSKIAQSNPLINKSQKIISIDGGCGLKYDGQLNLMIIPDINCETDCISFISYDGFPKARALIPQKASEDSINIRWCDNEVKVLLESDGEFAYIQHVSSGRKLWIYSKFMYDESHCDDCTDYVLPVNKDDIVSLVYETSRGYIVKKDGVSGWYYGELERLEPQE